MTDRRAQLARTGGFAAITLAFAVTQPLVLIGLPLALFLVAWGPRVAWTAAVVGAILALSFLGERTGVWWFERGWPLLAAGMYLWVSAWRPGWNFITRALAALAMAAAAATVICLASPAVWLELDASMAQRAAQAARAAMDLLGERADDTLGTLMQKVAAFQATVFPALLGISTLGSLGLAVSLRGWLAADAGSAFGRLRSFRFNDQLVWVWLGGLLLLLAPLGEIARRVGSNAVFFMGALYVFRGLAVLLSLVGGFSVAAGVVAGAVALLISPILALALGFMLLLGLGDTWLNVRERIRAREKDR